MTDVFANLLPQSQVEKLVREWLIGIVLQFCLCAVWGVIACNADSFKYENMDSPSFDVGGFVVGTDAQVAILYCKAKGVLAGAPFFNEVFRQVGDCRVEWHFADGSVLDPSKSLNRKLEVARVYGPAKNILLAERPALNMLARASGVATRCHKLRAVKEAAGWHGVIAGTRKTTPGFRLIEKYAMLVGGVDTHRMDLSSMIMLKDNHIWATGSISGAVAKARKAGGFSVKIEVECQNEAEADEAIEAGADIVMLDNFDGPGIKVAAKSLKERWASKAKFLIEGSGGLTEDNVDPYFSPALYGLLAFEGLRKKSLSVSGALAAGNIFPLLLAFYMSSSRLTKIGSKKKESLEEDFKIGGQRTAVQVLSNGFTGTFIACIHYMFVVHENGDSIDGLCFGNFEAPSEDTSPTVWLLRLNTALIAAYIGHYACCNGDTWASELGVLSPGRPILITTMKQVPKGTNGGISLLGLIASIVGGGFVGLVGAFSFVMTPCFNTSIIYKFVILGSACGLFGSLVDSLFGATLQRSTFNKKSGKITQDFRRAKKNEDRADLVVVSGWEVLDNHQVNFVSSLMTAIAAGSLVFLIGKNL
ncbi:hypothetical protein HK100_006808 [Physocladia obscura]|uniref:Nicotinate-nucleotide pyrophosphorylase [carboxylating] n=1 Tax=Physocladia obscura TaxID=109957 RepID=A0AAD5TAY1_9FUNG|nr:hypothetical protein HK100_006808 [Physocladia obscura]